MDLVNTISYIPKLAGGLLVLIGLLIVFEVYLMAKPNKDNKKKKEKELQPDEMQPLQFSTSAPKPQKKSYLPNIPVSQKAIITTIILLILLTLMLLAVHYIFILRGDLSINTEPEQQSVKQLPKPKPTIRIYQVDSQGTWKQLSEEELKKLLRGEEIRITVEYPSEINDIQFVINGETYVGDSTQKSPQGDPYILYTIPNDKQNFYIEVYVD